MTPLDNYEQHCKTGHIEADKQQLLILQDFQRVYFALIQEQSKRSSWIRFFRRPQLIHGIYLWGSVGVGKTFIMDCFYQSLPFKQKMRMHFHAFLQFIHQQLASYQGKKDPLKLIAKNISKKVIVLCFDECFVNDVTDAMLLKRLFHYLFEDGVCLVTTSNSKPDDLYQYGVQRLQFIPAIELLKKNTHVIHIESSKDYRLRHLREAGVFYYPLNQLAQDSMEKSFSVLSEGELVDALPLALYGRDIPVVKKTDSIIWFKFQDICSVPRSQNDYLAIAKMYRTVFISDIPVIKPNEKDQICLFINLVDVFYDTKTRLVMSAEQPISQLYERGHKILEYSRTHSRLQEMQSSDYFN